MRQAILIFGQLVDVRQEKKIRHSLLDIVIITIVAVMCGCTDWEEVAEFGRARLDVLKNYLKLPNGIPSHDTFRRVMGLVDPKRLGECYQMWVEAILPEARRDGDIISLDGKTVCGSGKPGFKPIHVVSAWSARAGITLGQLKTEEKSNEITAIPELLEILTIAGSVITIDAMGCQMNIAEKTIEKGADYVLACKDNQPTLCEEIHTYFAYADENPKERDENSKERILRRQTEREKGHGRIERRTYSLIEDCAMLTRFHDFPGAKSIGRVQSHVELRNGTVRGDTRYYITSLGGEDALQRFAKAARKHWGIENSCHWVLDVTFGEDACRTRDAVAAQNLTVARKLALALSKRVPDEIVEKYSHNQAKYTSMKKRLFLAGLYPDFMVEILLAGS